jgi:hypothetical protein
MGQSFESIDDELAAWIAAQRLFFVATAPLAADGHVNCSPKGGDTLRVLGPREVAWVDSGGSGIETVAHLRENGRLVVMFCAFEGPARIVRLHGRGRVVVPGDADFPSLHGRVGAMAVVRCIVRLEVTRVSRSCGYGVPFYDFREPREDVANYLGKTSDQSLRRYLVGENSQSIDGLPGMQAGELEQVVIRRELLER